MAMSFTRPDPGNPAQIADASFSTARRGFDQHEVRDFLQMVATEMSRLSERVRFLEREVDAARTSPEVSARLDEETLTRLLGEETARVLTTAKASAADIREKAEQAAAQLVSEASTEAARLREEVELEVSRRRADAAQDAEAELEMAKQQGREMVNEARAYRERVLSELSRRRELAREQIEQLIHGRDRLVAAFERARVAAVDVMAELEPIGQPDEYVNLAPTTGPVPVMVARDDHDGDAGRPAAPPIETTADGADADDGDAGVADAAVAVADPADLAAHDADGVALFDGEAPEVADESTPDNAGGHVAVEAEDGVDDVAEVGADVSEGQADDVAEGELADDVDGADDADVDAAVADEVDGAVDDHEDGAVDGEADDVVDDEVEDAPERDTADHATDDVVVDLFARLRHATRHDAEIETETETDADGSDADTDTDTTDAGSETDAPTDPVDGVASVDGGGTIAAAVGELHDVAHRTLGDDAEASDDQIDDADPFERRDAELTPLIVAAARRLKRVLADEQNDVLDALRRADAVASIDELLPVEPEQAGRYVDAISDDLLIAAQAGASSTDPHGVVPLPRRDARTSVDRAGDQLAERLVAPLRHRLERAVAESGGEVAALTKTVRAAYREVKTRHIDDVLDDVLRAAHGAGRYAALPTDAAAVWVVDPRHAACPDCEDNALAPPVLHGEPFPTGHTATPAHPGCRCMLQIRPR